MSKSIVQIAVAGVLLALGTQAAIAAPDWSKVPKLDIQVFHPGVTAMEWIVKKSDHSGTAGLRRVRRCKFLKPSVTTSSKNATRNTRTSCRAISRRGKSSASARKTA